MAKRRLDALLVTDLGNIRYASGFSGSAAVVVISLDRAVIFVDSRYTLQAREECPDFEVIQFKGDVFKAVGDLAKESNLSRIGYEAANVTCAKYRKIRSAVEKGRSLVSVQGLIEEVRQVKDAGEIAKLRKAAAITDDCFSYLVSHIEPGMTEKDVALDIYVFLVKNGADKPAFDSIVAAGPHAAFPHAKPGDAVIQRGQMLKMDFGASFEGYSADITRTIFIGEPDEKQREVYNIVLEAQKAAIEAIRPGKTGKEIDAVARDYIASHGYSEYFGHGLGHSLGIATHDGALFAPTSELVLEPGMVMTVEPGIYIEGWGGVRIEDDILVTDSGVEILTKSTKEIVVI